MTNGNGVYKWVAATAVGALLAIGGAQIQRSLLNSRVAELEAQSREWAVMFAGPGGFTSQLTEVRGDVRRLLDRQCPGTVARTEAISMLRSDVSVEGP